MPERSLSLQQIRPLLKVAKVTDIMSDQERFQNSTLRPIIKLQNDLLLVVFDNYIKKRKNVFYQLTIEKRLQYIANAIRKDLKLRNSLAGMIIGHFTIEEYSLYKNNTSALTKRIMSLIIQRIQDQIQFFNNETLV